MTTMTKKMSEAGSGRVPMKETTARNPVAGDEYRCKSCGMEIQVTKDCGCEDPAHVHFHCCGQEMKKM